MWLLYIRTDNVAYGPFATEDEALDYARQYFWGAAYDHANDNADFVACRQLMPPGRVVGV